MPGSLAAIIALRRRPRRRGHSGFEPVLDLLEPVEIVAGKGKIILAQKVLRREDFRLADRRSNMDPRFQAWDEALSESPMVFSRHDLLALYAGPAARQLCV